MKFETNKTYTYTTGCDSQIQKALTVVRRTDNYVTLEDSDGNTKRRKVFTVGFTEKCFPLGEYSLCPILSADQNTISMFRIM